ncbi:MAG: thioredoxin domain-containing protein [Candidatus Komeilibacteria bacterium]|nr:thioredoxin domain-containing protein [Candidatus Komeilibacteria bacterium]
MKLLKKYWWVGALAALLIILYFAFSSGPKVEYAELNTEPHFKGNPESSVVLVEWSDFQCPACGAVFPLVKEILATYGDKIKFQYRHLPLTSIHPYAYRAAEASECAGDQGKFWEYHDLLFANQRSLTRSDLQLYAGQVEGLDAELWQDCVSSGVKSKIVDADLAEAKKQGYNSTPTFLLNGQKVDDWSALPQLVQAMIEPLVPLRQATSTPQ